MSTLLDERRPEIALDDVEPERSALYTARDYQTVNDVRRPAWHLSNPDWWESITQQLTTIQALPPNWNGYGESRIAPASINAAVRLLVTMRPCDNAPHVSPVADGGIQIEWGLHGDVVVEVDPRGQGVAYVVGAEEDEWCLVEAADINQLFRRIEHVAG